MTLILYWTKSKNSAKICKKIVLMILHNVGCWIKQSDLGKVEMKLFVYGLEESDNIIVVAVIFVQPLYAHQDE